MNGETVYIMLTLPEIDADALSNYVEYARNANIEKIVFVIGEISKPAQVLLTVNL